MRRAVSQTLRAAAVSAAQCRFQSAPAWVKPGFVEIYNSNFATAEYPAFAVGGDHLQFSKLMYQLAKSEQKEEKYLSDLQGLLAKQSTLSPFWRTKSNVADDKEFQNLEAGVRFVLRWMQTSAQMDKLEDVVKIFAVYTKAAKKTLVVPVTLAGLPESQGKQIEEAKKAAQAALAAHHPDKKDWKLEFEYLVDPGIIDGWRLEVGSLVVEDMRTYLDAVEKAASAAHTVDFMAGPVSHALPTQWPQNAETEILADWCEELTIFDAEEAQYGA